MVLGSCGYFLSWDLVVGACLILLKFIVYSLKLRYPVQNGL